MKKYNLPLEVGILLVSILGLVVGVVAFIPQVVYRVFSKRYDLAYYLHQITVANDVVAGSFIYGSRHTVSAITGLYAEEDFTYHKAQAKFINKFFGRNHCKKEAIDELLIEDVSDGL